MSKYNESRRKFFQNSLVSSVGIVMAPSVLGNNEDLPLLLNQGQTKKAEWRNKQNDMSYRMLGKTGLMVSEIVLGTFPFNDSKSIPVIDAAVERGVNYLDVAAAYSNGEVEKVVGQFLKKPGNRDKVFVSTKLSSFYNYLDHVVDEIVKGLTQAKKDTIQAKANELINRRSVLKPGYHFNYFKGQEAQVNSAYFRHFVLQEYGFKAEWKKKIKSAAYQLLTDGLTRLQTDYVDVLHCPHGVAMPEMLDDDILRELFAEFKQKGMVRNAGVSFHNDVSANLAKAVEVGYYDLAMFAYNIANHAALENLMYKANQAGMGLIAMKVAKPFSMNDSPQWRLEKLNTAIPDKSLSKFAKAYLWALQNPNLSCCVSQMETIEKLKDNLQVVGEKVTIKSV